MLSRRVLLEKEREKLSETTLETLKEGQIVEGVIKNITDYGAFIDLGGIDGLLHITDMSWGRVNHPSELFKVGDEVKVKVLKFDPESERVSLGPEADPAGSLARRGDALPGRHAASAARSSRSPTTAPSSSSSRASRASSTSPRCPGRSASSTPRSWSRSGDVVEAVVLDVDEHNRRSRSA